MNFFTQKLYNKSVALLILLAFFSPLLAPTHYVLAQVGAGVGAAEQGKTAAEAAVAATDVATANATAASYFSVAAASCASAVSGGLVPGDAVAGAFGGKIIVFDPGNAFINIFSCIQTSFGAAGSLISSVADSISALQNTFTAGHTGQQVRKEFFYDPITKIIAGTLIRAMTNQVIGWIQGGNTGFVSNLDLEFRRATDRVGGEFLNNLTGLNLCGNIGAFLKISLRTPGLRQRVECTVSDIVANVNKFYRNFEEGGWQAFISIGLEPQNTAAGAYLIALDAKITAESKARETLAETFRAGSGFLGLRVPKEVCDEISEEVAGTVEAAEAAAAGAGEERASIIRVPTSEVLRERGAGFKICHTEYAIKTPGQLVSQTLAKSVNIGYDFAVVADEIDEAIAAIVTTLLQKLISSTFTALAGDSGSSGQGIFDPGLSRIPFTGRDLQGSSVFSRINEGLFKSDALLTYLDEQWIAARKEIFLTKTPGDTLGGAEEKRLSDILSPKKETLAIQKEFLLVDGALSATSTAADFAKLAAGLPSLLLRNDKVAEKIKNVPPAPATTGNLKLDTLTLLRDAEKNIRQSAAVLDDILRVATSTATTNSLSARRSAILLQRTFLQNSLADIQRLQNDLLRTSNQDRIQNIADDTTRKLLDANRLLLGTMDLVAEIDRVIIIPFTP